MKGSERKDVVEMTVVQAGRELRRSYNQVHRLLMLGLLRGGQNENGRWWVDAADVRRLAHEQKQRKEA